MRGDLALSDLLRIFTYNKKRKNKGYAKHSSYKTSWSSK